MKTRTRLDRELLEDRFTIDLDSGSIRYRKPVKGNRVGSPAGTIRSDGYVRVRIDGKPRFAHRIIYFMATGEEPSYIDHVNGKKDDNRITNLRAASNSENMCNHQKRKPQGVYLRGSKWHGRVMKNYQTHRIRPTEDRAEAVRRLHDLRKSLHRDFAAC